MPASFYSHPRLIQLIQQRQPEHDDTLDAVQDAHTLVRDMKQALRQAEQQLAQAQEQLQQTIPAQQEHCQLVRELQAIQCACWNRSLSAELSGLILGKTSRYNVRMVDVSCPLLRDTVNTAEPIKFEISPWARTRIAAGGEHTLCVSTGGWICSHVVRECGRPRVWMGLERIRSAGGWRPREQSGTDAGDWIATDQDSRASHNGKSSHCVFDCGWFGICVRLWCTWSAGWWGHRR